MRSLAAPLAALTLLAAAPAPPPAFEHAGTICSRPLYNGSPGATVLFGGSGANDRTNAVVVAPSDPVQNAPAVLWVHWLGERATTNHTEFLPDAEALAKRGVVSLLVDMPWSQPDWFTKLRAPEHDYADTVAQVVTLRRALDCLTQVRGVDKTRVAFVGHDFGAMDGAVMLAVDDRVRYAVLMTPTLSFWEWYLLGKQPADPAAYVAQMSAFDLPGWLAKGKQKATMLQFGQNDEYVSQATGIAVRNALAGEKTFAAYKLDHSLDDATARDARQAWLIAHLGV